MCKWAGSDVTLPSPLINRPGVHLFRAQSRRNHTVPAIVAVAVSPVASWQNRIPYISERPTLDTMSQWIK